jgi:hypothetical protein
MRGVMTGMAKEIRYTHYQERAARMMRITLELLVPEDGARMTDTAFMPGETVEVCFGGVTPEAARPLQETPVAIADDARSASW